MAFCHPQREAGLDGHLQGTCRAPGSGRTGAGLVPCCQQVLVAPGTASSHALEEEEHTEAALPQWSHCWLLPVALQPHCSFRA